MNDHEGSNDKQTRKLSKRFRVATGKGFRLDDWPTIDTMAGSPDKSAAEALLRQGVERFATLQDKLYADGRHALLVVFQAMDAGGKDGTIDHVMSGVNPQGLTVTSFKQPTTEELAHDFLWRIHRALPRRGMIGVFNRSHYEDILVTRVHPDLLEGQHLPPRLVKPKRMWAERIADIAAFEAYLGRQGITILKFFLHISPEEQKKRFLARLDDPGKLWKFAPSDNAERARWPDYMAAYQDAIAGTATEEAPWFVIPADQKWFARLAVVSAINAALDDLDLAFPVVSSEDAEKLKAIRSALEHEGEVRA